MRSAYPERNLKLQQDFLNQFVSLPFDDQAATIFGNIRAQLAAQGTPIGGYDLQIAAIALTNNLILVTHNTREFSRIPELKLEDWEIV
jgi:tRNA(fMet)-specific endonuclease VapC